MADERYWTDETPDVPLGTLVRDTYQLEDLITRTKMSLVYQGSILENGEKVVLKFIKRKEGKESVLENEIRIQRDLSHPYILRIIEDFPFAQFHVVVLPYAQWGSVESYQRKKYAGQIPETMAQRIIFKMMSAIQYLHGNDIAHCDIKPENFLLFDDNPLNPDVRLSDFGLAKTIARGETSNETSGTWEYLPPEAFIGIKAVDRTMDIWAIGITTFRLLTGHVPYTVTPKTKPGLIKFVKEIRKGAPKFRASEWADNSTESQAFVTRLMAADKSERPDAGEVLSDVWFTNIDTKENEIESLQSIFDDSGPFN